MELGHIVSEMKWLLLLPLILVVFFLWSCREPAKKGVLSQASLKKKLVPVLQAEGKPYQKFKAILARKAGVGEVVETRTADGRETINTAREGDYLVKNQTAAGEMYVVEKEEFEKRYEFLQESKEGFSEYVSSGRIIAVEMTASLLDRLNLDQEFYFVAPWGEEMVVKEDDFLVSSSNFGEVYRIARKEFFETYQLEE